MPAWNSNHKYKLKKKQIKVKSQFTYNALWDNLANCEANIALIILKYVDVKYSKLRWLQNYICTDALM